MDISKLETTVHFKGVGKKTKKTYEGSFVVRAALNNAEQISVAIVADRYSGGSVSLSPAAKTFNHCIADLEARIVVDTATGVQKAPSWWIGSDGGRKMYDPNIVLDLQDQAVKEGDAAFDKHLDAEIQAADGNKQKPHLPAAPAGHAPAQ
jgi:hypothetical protein